MRPSFQPHDCTLLVWLSRYTRRISLVMEHPYRSAVELKTFLFGRHRRTRATTIGSDSFNQSSTSALGIPVSDGSI